MQIIIGLVGERGSGKGTIAKYLVKKHNAGYYKGSQALDDILEILGMPKTRENEIAVAEALRSKFGEDVLIQAISQKITSPQSFAQKRGRQEKNKSKIVVVDGIRMPEEVKTLKKLPGFRLVYITCDEKIRFQRIKKRKEKAGESKLTLKAFKKLNKASTEKHITKLGKKAKFVIHTEGTYNQNNKKTEELINRIMN